jgi:Purple acid Phosphatase, N-terminal domain/Bacterial Ig-like domain (group 3)/Calcineurin-like phosphoesterase
MNSLSTSAPRRHAYRRRVGALALTAAVLASSAVVGSVVSAQAATTGPIDVLLGVGATESQRIVSWYFPSNAAQAVELEKTSDLTSGTTFNTSKKVISATSTPNTAADSTLTDTDTKSITGAATQTGFSNAHATILGLAENTTYSYHVGAKDGSAWSKTYTFSTKSFTGNFDFLFFGDPQIGSSGSPDQDGAGLAATLNYATSHDSAAELLVSGGDQIEHANNEYEWSSFADNGSDVLKQYPWAATIGNHDVGGKGYEQHNQLPNISKDADYYPSANTTTNSGGDYYYIYKGVLFIDINSNAYDGGSDAAHVSYIRSVLADVGDKAKWKVLVYHHSIYSPADHANDDDNVTRRADFTTAFSQMGINLVLQGHDHSYSRSYAILNGAKANPAEQPAQTEVFSGPGGVIYVTANSSSGSKYYELTTPTNKGGYGLDPLDPTGKRHFANSVENQEHVRTYVQVAVANDKLTVNDVRAGDCSAPNAAVERNNVSTCGVGLKATAQATPAAVGSSVDKFQLDKVVPSTSIATTASITSKPFGSTTPVTLTATVAGGLGTVSGNVSFYEGSTLLGTSPLTGTTATFTVPAALGVGTHAYTAKFASGSVFNGTDSASAPVNVDVAKATSSTTLAVAKGVATVNVTAPDLAVSGAVTIYDGTTAIGTATVTNGTGTAKVSLKTSGTHALHAIFAGTDTIGTSTSNAVNVKIAKSTSTVKYSKKYVTVTVKASGLTKAATSGTAKIYDGKKVIKTVKIAKGTSKVKVSLKKGTHKLHSVFALTTTIAASTSKTISVKIK